MIRKTIVLLTILTANISYGNDDDIIVQLQQRINELTNKVEQLDHKNDLLTKKIENLAIDTDYRFKEYTPSKKQTTESTPVKPGDPTKAKAEFEKSINLLKLQKYTQAEQALSNFVKAYPKNEYTGNAYYWLAESFMLRKQYNKAAKNYITSFNKFPKNSKADLSMLKLSSALTEIGKKKEACSTLKKLTAKKAKLSSAMQKMLQKEISKSGCK